MREVRDGAGEGGGGAKKRKTPRKRGRREVENEGDLGGKRKTRGQESVGSVAADRGYAEKMNRIQ